MTLTALMDALRDSPAFQHKQDIAPMLRDLEAAHGAVPVGDDCAVLADGDGYLLFAIEGFLNGFVARDPDFAGYCGVMVNVSDIYAMGGRPTAVVDALWSAGADQADAIMAGLRRAAGKYQVPVVGGHSNAHNDRAQLSVAIIGRAKRLLTSFDARPGDHLMVACDLRGAYRAAAPGEPDSHNWDASSDAPGERLRGDLELLPLIAERGLCRAAKDISMASFVGTTLMLLECSGVGGHLALNALPRPADVPLARWLSTFPSYGFVLAVPEAHRDAVTGLFRQRDLAIADVGRVHPGHRLTLSLEEEAGLFWDLGRTPFIGAPALQSAIQPEPEAHHARSAF